jgi:hypothetical protein
VIEPWDRLISIYIIIIVIVIITVIMVIVALAVFSPKWNHCDMPLQSRATISRKEAIAELKLFGYP